MPPGLRHALLLLGALALCPVAALVIGGDPAEPVRRAQALAGAEAALGLHVEPAAHAWAQRQGPLLDLAGAFYVLAHIGVAGWALVWTWYLRRDRFVLVRNAFLAAQVLTVAGWMLFPTAPPRLVPGTGVAAPLPEEGALELIQSPFAAMPSGHVVFALVAGATFAALGDRRWLRAFGWAYPPLMAAITIVTGHHLWLDALGAAAVATLAFAVAARARLAQPRRARSPVEVASPSAAARR
jgi:membrane-associated phospholipid phosphatase